MGTQPHESDEQRFNEAYETVEEAEATEDGMPQGPVLDPEGESGTSA